MGTIRHRVVVKAPLETVYEMVATAQGVSQWWTIDGVRGEDREGAKLEIFFGSPEPTAVMCIEKLDPSGHVKWKCVEGPEAWVGTSITYDLTPQEGDTAVMFAHSQWRDAEDFMAHCSARWAYFIISLKLLCETGHGTPVPHALDF